MWGRGWEVEVASLGERGQFHPFLFASNDLAGWAWSDDWAMGCSNGFHFYSVDATVLNLKYN